LIDRAGNPQGAAMTVIAIEEHFWSPGLRDAYPKPFVEFIRRLTGAGRLDDLGEGRIREMDAAGIDLQVLSHFIPGAQDVDAATAPALARDSNDHLHAAIEKHPDRLAGFATLPTPAPQAAADELERCVRKLGFKGALINGTTNGEFLDDEKYHVILARAEALGVPLYLHPRSPHPDVIKAYYQGHHTLSQAAWGYAAETGAHALRMILSGVFDKFPKLIIILGHLGENIPFALWRFDHSVVGHGGGSSYAHLQKRPRQYFLDNFVITTSGHFDPIALRCAISSIGADRILFAVDYPVESAKMATEFLRTAELSDEERENISHRNAKRYLSIR
jgi:predicted TIM-barrel fold metal-dependent hydrolase